MHAPYKKSPGSALITAIFIMTLVATVATAISLQLQVNIRRTQLVIKNDSDYNYSKFGLLWAIDKLLVTNKKTQQNPGQSHIEKTARKKTLSVDNKKIEVVITDLQSKFNINQVKDRRNITRFIRLMQTVSPTLSAQSAKKIALATHEWLSPLILSKGLSVNDNSYLKQQEPYNAAHRPMVSISELKLINGMTHSLYMKLSPYLCALPNTNTTINLQTSSAAVLSTLGVGLSHSQVNKLIQFRKNTAPRTLKQWLSNPVVKALKLPKKQLTLTSQYFLIVSSLKSEQSTVHLFTTIERKQNKKKVKIILLKQTTGSSFS